MAGIWFRPYQLSDLAAMAAGSLIAHLGMEFLEIGDDFLSARMPVDERTRQPFGLLHGGASVALAETLGSMAANMVVDRSKFYCVGQEVNANHLRAMRDGVVTGTAKPFHLGASSQVWGIEIRDDPGRLICVSRITMAARPL